MIEMCMIKIPNSDTDSQYNKSSNIPQQTKKCKVQDMVHWSNWFVSLTSVTHTHTRLTAPCPGIPRWAGTRKVKSIWILLKQETVCGSGISWNICKSALRSTQIAMPASHHSVFYRPDALPAAQPTATKHWRQIINIISNSNWKTLYEAP